MDPDKQSNSTITAKIETVISDVVYKPLDGAYGVSVLRHQQNNEWCDVLLYGEDSPAVGIKAHKMILSSASPHLREAFESQGFVDSSGNEYHVDQIDHTTLQIVVDFIYTSTLRLTGEKVVDQLELVLIRADYLLMPELVSFCGKKLTEHLKFKNVVKLWAFARRYHCKVLEKAALLVIASNINHLAGKDDFLNLIKADVVGLLNELRTIKAKPADMVCKAAVAWLDFKKIERKLDCDDVVRQISLKNVSTEELQRASKAGILSEQVLWAVGQVLGVRAEAAKKLTVKKRVSFAANTKSAAAGRAKYTHAASSQPKLAFRRNKWAFLKKVFLVLSGFVLVGLLLYYGGRADSAKAKQVDGKAQLKANSKAEVQRTKQEMETLKANLKTEAQRMKQDMEKMKIDLKKEMLLMKQNIKQAPR